MAPPHPPPSTHQSTTAAPSNRSHGARHAQHHPHSLEEPPSPAGSGRVDGSARAQVGSSTTTPILGTSSIPTAAGGSTSGGQALQSSRLQAGQGDSCSSGGLPPFPVSRTVTGKPVSGPRSVSSGDNGKSGRRGSIEEDGDSVGVLVVSANVATPDNAGQRKSAKNRPDHAQKLLDRLPERNAKASSVRDVPLEEGEVWERAPEQVLVEGSSIRAIFSSFRHESSMAMSGSVCPELSSPSAHNAGLPGRSRVGAAPRGALDARGEGLDGDGSTPGYAGGAGDHLAPAFPVAAPDILKLLLIAQVLTSKPLELIFTIIMQRIFGLTTV